MTGKRFEGLVVVLPRSGRMWAWVGFSIVRNKAGEEVRIEHWQAPCRFCREPFTATQKMPQAIIRRYLEKADEGASEVMLALPADRNYGNLQRVNCSRHLFSPAPQPTEIELVPGAEGLL